MLGKTNIGEEEALGLNERVSLDEEGEGTLHEGEGTLHKGEGTLDGWKGTLGEWEGTLGSFAKFFLCLLPAMC